MILVLVSNDYYQLNYCYTDFRRAKLMLVIKPGKFLKPTGFGYLCTYATVFSAEGFIVG